MGRLKRWNPVRRYRAFDLRRARNRYREARWAETQSVLALVGTMTITWAGIESILDEVIAWYHRTGGKAVRWDHPRSLSAKVEYMKKMEPDVRFSHQDRATLRRIRLETNRVGTERHKLVHGFLHLGPFRKNWSLHRTIYDGSDVSIEVSDFTSEHIRKVLSDMAALASILSPFARDVCWRRGPTGSGIPQALKPSNRGRGPT